MGKDACSAVARGDGGVGLCFLEDFLESDAKSEAVCVELLDEDALLAGRDKRQDVRVSDVELPGVG